MKSLIILSCGSALLFALACTKEAEDTGPKPTTTVAPAQIAPPQAPSPESEQPLDEFPNLKTEADFEDAADALIAAENVEAQLAALEKEIGADSPTP